MTITDTTTPTRSRRPSRHRARPRPARRRPLPILRRRHGDKLPRIPDASYALASLMNDEEADIYKVGRRYYLVAPLTAALIDILFVTAGATEDDEDGDPGGGADDVGEPSLGTDDDLESDGLESGEPALGWANEGSQEHLGWPQADEAEPSLGWNNDGMHLRLVAGYSVGTIRESDGDCDDEPDNEDFDPLDKGEQVDEDGASA